MKDKRTARTLLNPWFCLILVLVVQFCFLNVSTRKGLDTITTTTAMATTPSATVADPAVDDGKALLHPKSAKKHFTTKDMLSPEGMNSHTIKMKSSSLFTAFHPFNTTADLLSNDDNSNLFHADHHQPGFQYPPLHHIVNDYKNNEVVGDPQFLLDFGIVGFAKCGTSTMMEWLGLHPEVSCFQGEVPFLNRGKIGGFIKRLYNGLDHDPRKLRGYKNPPDINNLRAIRFLREYFPHTKLFIGIRHPVLWFQSLYNHRIQNTGRMPSPDKAMKRCIKDNQGVCGSRAHFHLPLVRLGKTNYAAERDAFSQKEWDHLLKDHPVRSPNPIFLFDTEQLGDTDPVRLATFRRDVQTFLGLSMPLQEEHPHYSPGKKLNATTQAERNERKLDICQEQHAPLRQELLTASQHAAFWIRTYFLKAPDVFVSSPDFFDQIMDSYMRDPCDKR